MWAVSGDLAMLESVVKSESAGAQSHLVMHAWPCISRSVPHCEILTSITALAMVQTNLVVYLGASHLSGPAAGLCWRISLSAEAGAHDEGRREAVA